MATIPKRGFGKLIPLFLSLSLGILGNILGNILGILGFLGSILGILGNILGILGKPRKHPRDPRKKILSLSLTDAAVRTTGSVPRCCGPAWPTRRPGAPAGTSGTP